MIALSVLCLALVGVALASPAQNYEIVRHVFGSGGGDYFEQGNYRLNNTLGQPVVGKVVDADTKLCVGFWCGSALLEFDIFLPLVIKNLS